MRRHFAFVPTGDIASGVCCGSFAFRHACVGKKAPVGPTVHQNAALLTGYATGGYSGHGDFVFCSAVAFMRSCEPFYKFGHARNMRCGLWANVAIFRVYCQSST
jgi:hypothetical protein